MLKAASQALGRARWLVGKHLWPVRLNRLCFIGRRLTHRWRLVHRAESSITGPITVWDLGRERRLVFGEHVDSVTQSAVFTSGRWSELWREYWGRVLKPPVSLPQHPRLLLVGLGGGTIVRMAYQSWRPSGVVVVELDSVVLKVAMSYMGLDELPDLHAEVGDAREVLDRLHREEPFDLVIEDVFFGGLPGSEAEEAHYLDQLMACVAPGGALVLNRWFAEWSGEKVDSGQDRTAALLAERFTAVDRHQIRQRWFNELIVASVPRHDPLRPSGS